MPKVDLAATRRNRVAALAGVDPRTVQAYLDGRPVLRITAKAIEAGLRLEGLEKLVRRGSK